MQYWGLYETSMAAPATAFTPPGFSNLRSLISQTSGKELNRTQGAGASQRKMTFNFWFRTPGILTDDYLVYETTNTPVGDVDWIGVLSGAVTVTLDGTIAGNVQTTTGLTATNTWYQVTVWIDTANAVAADRVKFFVNGVQDTTFVTTPVTLNYNTGWGGNGETEILMLGRNTAPALVDEMVRVSNTLLPASTFATAGAPIDLSTLIFGAQDIWIRFESGVAATVGNDSSGNGNNFTNAGFVDGDFSSTVP